MVTDPKWTDLIYKGYGFESPYEYPLTAPPRIEHIVCNCNMTWGGIFPPPPCGLHEALLRVPVETQAPSLGHVWVGETKPDIEKWLKLIYGPLAEAYGPLLMMELLMHFLPFE